MYKVVITTQDGRTIYCKAKNTRTIIFAQLPYSFIVKHNDHPFLGQFYYGEKGINPYSEAYVRIQQLEKQHLLSSVTIFLELRSSIIRWMVGVKKLKNFRILILICVFNQ